MQKTILITGATDGIGLLTARRLLKAGHKIILHGRNQEKLNDVTRRLSQETVSESIEPVLADLSSLDETRRLAETVLARHQQLDVLINNAGVFRAPHVRTKDGLDVRFAVNTIAPYLLTKLLLKIVPPSGRVINVASAAQASVDPEALAGRKELHDDFEAYAQSKLALIMWTRWFARHAPHGPVFIAVNPGSLLDTKMVREVFGRARAGAEVGAEIICRLTLLPELSTASGRYFDNDSGRFMNPHPDALDDNKVERIVQIIDRIASKHAL